MTEVLRTLEELNTWKASQDKQKLGFVPTMGNLHSGHLALIKDAQTKADSVIVSIFVNPTQFGVNEDFDQYPRSFEADLLACQEVGVDAVFVPSIELMYPEGVRVTHQAPPNLANRLCGASRVGHFDGVLSVVHRLFSLIQPNLVVFGQKDAQQVAVIKSFIETEEIPITLVTHPVVRDTDGLALSSRNQYLQS